LRHDKNVHKNDFGHLLVIAGSPAMLGASCLVSLAAMRFWAGLVTAAVPSGLNLTLQEKISHAVMTLPVPPGRGVLFTPSAFNFLNESWGKYSAVAIGPGIGRAPATINFVKKCVSCCPLPMVIDADAIHALGKGEKSVEYPRILTPHPGEFFELTGLKPLTDRARRMAAKEFSTREKVVLVLKGHRTVVAAPDGRIYVNTTGNQGMAKAGTGDVLTGMIAALLAQGINAFDAAKQAVYWHGAAGDKLGRRMNIYSFTAIDLINLI